MKNAEMCAALGRAHEFFLALKKAGFTDELIQEIINSKNNALAKQMFNDLHLEYGVTVLSDVISSSPIPATTKKFIAKFKFVVNTSKTAKVKISYLNCNFKFGFIDKNEEAFSGSVIDCRDLNRVSVDDLILGELGGRAAAQTTLTEMHAMLERQPYGQKGALLTNGSANIFYITNIKGELCAFGVSWDGDGWDISANYVDNSDKWPSNSRVFYKNPLSV